MSLGPKMREAGMLRANGDGADARFVLIALFTALVVALVTTFGPHGASAAGVQRRLGEAARGALVRTGIVAIKVTMKGQTAYLDGAAPDRAAAARAARVVLAAAGKGGFWDGGIVAVVDRVAVGDLVSPFTWKAVRRNDVVTLSGRAPSDQARAALAAKARALFPGGVHDEQAVAAGAPSGDWLGVAMGALEALAALPEGDARLVGRRLFLMGEGDRAAVNKVKAYYAARDLAPFATVLDVSEAGAGAPEMAGIRLAGADAGRCQEAFSRIMARNVINFGTGSAVISPTSLRVLDTLAAVARRCDAYSIEVDGHTDNVGARDANMSLSRARALAVVNYLSADGVAAARVSAVGLGPDRPVASNVTPAGQARNRRIDFQVRS